MGWTSWNTAQDKMRFPTAGDYLANSYTRTATDGRVQTVLAHRMVGGVWYAALRVQGGAAEEWRVAIHGPLVADYVTGLVVLTEGRWGAGWSYKDMDETMGPYESRCPAAILNLLTPIMDHPHATSALAWRERCRNGGRRAS